MGVTQQHIPLQNFPRKDYKASRHKASRSWSLNLRSFVACFGPFQFAPTLFDNLKTRTAAYGHKSEAVTRSNNPFDRSSALKARNFQLLWGEERALGTATDLLSGKKFQLVKSRRGYEERLICRWNYRHSVRKTYVESLRS